MPLSASQWHQRFQQQAAWTESVRGYLLAQAGLPAQARILEVGCGSGVITAALNGYAHGNVYGLDLNREFLALAGSHDPLTRFTCGDARDLPFATATFDAVVCHYFLLWVAQPAAALAEMVRVTRPSGAVIACAEPDYGGRIDYPAQFAEIGRLQSAALREQGADPEMGRKLSGLFHAAGLHDIASGLLGGQWKNPPAPEPMALEWDVIQADLGGKIPQERLDQLREEDAAAWQSGERVLFVPTFYAIGRK